MRRRREQGPLNNPTLIGALTVLVTIVAVALAYNANNGLPFVPRYSLHVQIADAAELTHGAEVHMSGGALVGAVQTIQPTRTAAGVPIAQLNLELNKTIEPLPADSTFTVRLKAAIGLKYLQITRGTSTQMLKNGATVPLSQSGAEVDLDQVLSMFNAPTRAGVAASTIGFSDALAGRGGDINNAIGAFVPLVTDLGPVMQNLRSPRTNLGGFFNGLERYTSALTPVAQTQASLFTNLDTTFTALASVAYPFIQNWISDTPPAFNSVINNGPTIGSFLNDTAGLFADLEPGTKTIPKSAPVLTQAFIAGAANLPGTIGLDQETTALSKSIANYTQHPGVLPGLARLTQFAASLKAPLAYLTPVQSSCNYVTLFLRNIASVLSENVRTGTALRFNLVSIADVAGSESVASHRPYLTPHPTVDQLGPLHANPYPNTDSPGQTPECAAGKEPYSASHYLIGNPPANVGLATDWTHRSVG